MEDYARIISFPRFHPTLPYITPLVGNCGVFISLFSFIFACVFLTTEARQTFGEDASGKQGALLPTTPESRNLFYFIKMNNEKQQGNAAALEWQDKQMLTFKEACRYLGITKDWLYKMTHRRAIPYFKPGGKMIYFHRADLDAYMSKGKVMSNAEIEAEAAAKKTKKALKGK